MRARALAACVRVGAFVTAAALLGACESRPSDPDAAAAVADRPDARLVTHVVLPSTPTAEGLAYIEAVAGVHERADAASGARRVGILREGLAIPVPAGLGEAEILRLEMATRLAETLADDPHGLAVAIELLQPMLATERSLPVDRATARALVVLGDVAAKTGDDALAAGSYARAIRVMSLLRQDLEQELEP